jgi:hypothetical protein
MIGAIITEIAFVVPLQVFGPSRFLTVIVSVMVGSVWWIVGYQRLSRTRGWESLKDRFSPLNGWIILTSTSAKPGLSCAKQDRPRAAAIARALHLAGE